MQYQDNAPFMMKIERDGRRRIARKTEIVAGGEPRVYTYRYDKTGGLAGVDIGFGEAETYVYDREGRRIESQVIEPEFRSCKLRYATDDDGADRLVNIDGGFVEHDENGFRSGVRPGRRAPGPSNSRTTRTGGGSASTWTVNSSSATPGTTWCAWPLPKTPTPGFVSTTRMANACRMP